MKIEFFVPEIRGKGRPRLTRNGHAFTDEKTRNYENLVKWRYYRERIYG